MRTYTRVGKDYSAEEIDNAIGRTLWEDFRKINLPFMQGECIKSVIASCKIPLSKISRMCLQNYIKHNGEDHGFYGLDITYKNGQAQLYVADNGCDACVVASDFQPTELCPTS